MPAPAAPQGGGFRLTAEGETDTRGCYTALASASVLVRASPAASPRPLRPPRRIARRAASRAPAACPAQGLLTPDIVAGVGDYLVACQARFRAWQESLLLLRPASAPAALNSLRSARASVCEGDGVPSADVRGGNGRGARHRGSRGVHVLRVRRCAPRGCARRIFSLLNKVPSQRLRAALRAPRNTARAGALAQHTAR